MARKKFYNDIVVTFSNNTKNVTDEKFVTIPGESDSIRRPVPGDKSYNVLEKIQVAAIFALYDAGWKVSQISAALRISYNVASFHVNARAKKGDELDIEWAGKGSRLDIRKGLLDEEGQL